MQADSIRMARKHVWTFLMASARRSFKRLYLEQTVTRSLLFHPETPDSLVRMFMSQAQEESWRAGNEMKTILPNPAALHCRVTVIGGQEDFMVSRESTEATAAAYKTKAIYLDRCAHMVPLEADATQLANIIHNAIRSA
jgi:pimeloyl-ACP methyl ester carboxylesterase